MRTYPNGGGASRRSVLAAGLMAAAGTPLVNVLATGVAHADPATTATATAEDRFGSNTALYQYFRDSADSADGEGHDFARRFRRHELLDDSKSQTGPAALTTVLGIHAGGIEIGTSELCLGVAGYNPDPTPVPPAGPILYPDGPLYDYWMFEGLRTGNDTYPDGSPKTNRELHVTSTHCDDHIARSMVAGSLNTLSLHGCTWEDANPGLSYVDQDRKGLVIGGRSQALRDRLRYHLAPHYAIFPGDGDINGSSTANICNRTMLDEGAQLELTTELRRGFFAQSDGAANRAKSYNEDFKLFVGACRAAIAEVEAGQRVALLL